PGANAGSAGGRGWGPGRPQSSGQGIFRRAAAIGSEGPAGHCALGRRGGSGAAAALGSAIRGSYAVRAITPISRCSRDKIATRSTSRGLIRMATPETGTWTVKKGLAQMLKGGVIMDVVTPEHALIAQEAGAVSVMALERVPSDIRRDGGVARMSDPSM